MKTATQVIKTYKPNDTARIEAMRVDYTHWAPAMRWAGADVRIANREPTRLMVNTLEGWVELPDGHYLIRGTNGEFYPCDPEVFEKRWVETTKTITEYIDREHGGVL